MESQPINEATAQVLRDFFRSLYISREGLTPHYFPIPFEIADKAVAQNEVPLLWKWILTQIPSDATPDGGLFHDLQAGKHINRWGMPFISEAFGRQTDAGTLKGGKLCIVDIDYFNYPNV